MEAKAHLKYLRISPRKVKILCDLIRGKENIPQWGAFVMNELRQSLFRHMISSGSFRSAHCFLSFLPATATTNRLSLRACTGQTAVQRMQVMQRISSVSMGCFRGMAFTGQTAAHLPHRVHCFPACGWTSRPPKGRRSVFSGMGTGGSSL